MALAKTSDFIQKVLIEAELLNLSSSNREYPLSFYVHESLIKKLEKRLNEMFTRDGWKMFEKILRFGNKWFEMYLIIVSRGTAEQLRALCELITSSQYSFPLEVNPTVFTETSSKNIMKELIRQHQLEPYIIEMDEMIGISTEEDTIRVITFNKSINKKLDIIEEFRYKLRHMTKKYFYMAFGLPWDRISILPEDQIHGNVCFVFPIILQHLGSINYKNELNIIDLISLRLATCDIRDPLQANYMKSEIDFMVKRQLLNYVKNNIFDLHQYLIDRNCEDDLSVCSYLIYEYQEYFTAINYNYKDSSTNYRTNVKYSIKLKYENDVLNTIRDNFSVHYDIDGRGFDKMCSSLFFGLLKCKNVFKIDLDTNYQWAKDVAQINIIDRAYRRRYRIVVNMRGENTDLFVDDCLAELKKLEFHQIELNIKSGLADFRILDNLTVEQICFDGSRIDTDMLKQLHECNFISPLRMHRCTMENSSQAWELLNNLKNFREITIIEDDGTWESIFEFVIQELHRTNSSDFKFQIKDIRVYAKGSNDGDINLELFKFAFGEQMSKLEIRDANSDELVDLFYAKFRIEPDEKTDFEFYQ